MKGRCYCGEVQFEVMGKPVLKAQCHCRECQYITGGGPNYFMTVPEDGYRITRGMPKEFTRSDIPNPRTRQFCPTCGTHLTTLIKARGLVVVKIGTLDNPAEDYRGPRAAIYMKDTQPYHVVPEGLPCFEDLPPPA